MTPKEFINIVNEYIKDKEPVQSRYYEEWLCDFNIDHDNISYEIVWQGDTDEHRWYELSDIVFKITGRGGYMFAKTTLLTKTYSESQPIKDCYHEYQEFKIVNPVEITTVVYE